MNPAPVDSQESLAQYLSAEHRRLDERLKALERQISLTASEQAEYVRLKKQKLLTKDQLARLSG